MVTCSIRGDVGACMQAECLNGEQLMGTDRRFFNRGPMKSPFETGVIRYVCSSGLIDYSRSPAFRNAALMCL